jgi:hypothetical protein
MQYRCFIWISVYVISSLGLTSGPCFAYATIQLGSNYGWYAQDIPAPPETIESNPFSNYNVIQNYDTETQAINSQLIAMREAGQTTIAVPIYPAVGFDSQSLLDETGGNLNQHDLTNFKDFIAQVKADGFTSILYRFNFQAYNAPQNATPAMTAINSEFIANMMNEVIIPAGVPYVTDLTGELASYSITPAEISYGQYLWMNYVNEFGTNNTIGFSTNHVWNQSGIANMLAIFNGIYPEMFGFEIYTDDRTNGVAPSPSQQIISLNQDLIDDGINRPWIITETYYDDPTIANGIALGIAETGQQIDDLYQWQINGPDTQDNTIPPIQISAYKVLNETQSEVPEPETVVIFLIGITITILMLHFGRGQ